jgi:HD-GYP domain-containing protein (c-di-GMP phosphodiesterase class II)
VDVVAAVVGVVVVHQHERQIEERSGMTEGMIERMDKAMLAMQAAFTARKLYGVDHAVVQRQLDLACETLAALLSARPELRIVRLEQSLVFDDVELPSCGSLAQALTPRLASHGIEWLEFRAGVTRAELVTLLDQLERAPAELLRSGTTRIRVGRVGRSEAAATDAAVEGGALATDQTVTQFRGIWQGLHSANGSPGGPIAPDQRLGELVESIRLAVAVGADVCKQLAEVKSHDEYTFVHTGERRDPLGGAGGGGRHEAEPRLRSHAGRAAARRRQAAHAAGDLNKPGKLDDAERKKMEQHTTAGAAMLFARRGVPDVAPIVAFEHHAERGRHGLSALRRSPAGCTWRARSCTWPDCVRCAYARTARIARRWTTRRCAASCCRGRARRSMRRCWIYFSSG